MIITTNELKELACRAIGNPKISGERYLAPTDEIRDFYDAVSPQTILRLCDRVDKLEQLLKTAKERFEESEKPFYSGMKALNGVYDD